MVIVVVVVVAVVIIVVVAVVRGVAEFFPKGNLPVGTTGRV